MRTVGVAYNVTLTSGNVVEICGPSERRVCLWVGAASSAMIGAGPILPGTGTLAFIPLAAAGPPLVFHRATVGDLIKSRWGAECFDSSPTIVVMEVTEVPDDEPLATPPHKD